MKPPTLFSLLTVLLGACGNTSASSPLSQISPISAQHIPGAAYAGAWTVSGKCRTTIAQGASTTFVVEGATRVTAQAHTPPDGGYPSTLAVRVDGQAWTTLDVPVAQSSQQVLLVPSLTPTRHTIEVVVSGVYETSPLWTGAAGLTWCGVEGDTYLPVRTVRGTALFMGDSITAGIVVRGHATAPNPASTPRQSAAELAWPYLAAEALGLASYPVAFGGSGITVPGNGGAPTALEQFKRFAPDKADLVTLNYGANDAGRKALPQAYLDGYAALIRAAKVKYPSAQIVVLGVVAGDQELNAGLPGLAQELGVTYVAPPEQVSTVDGTHPDPAGNRLVAATLVTGLR